MPEVLDTLCGDCGANLREYETFNRVTGEATGTHIVCPNQWMMDHP